MGNLFSSSGIFGARNTLLAGLCLLALSVSGGCGGSSAVVSVPVADTGAQPVNYFMASDFAAAANAVCSLTAGTSDVCNTVNTSGPVAAVIVVENPHDNVNYTVTIDDGQETPVAVETFTVNSGAGATAAGIEAALVDCINGAGSAPCDQPSALVEASSGSIVLVPLIASGEFGVSLSDDSDGYSMLAIGPTDGDLTAFLYMMYSGFAAPTPEDLWAEAVTDMVLPDGFPPASGTALLELSGYQEVNCNDTDGTDGTLRVDTSITVEVDSAANLTFVEETNSLDFSGCTLTGAFLGRAYDQSVALDGVLSFSVRQGTPSVPDPNLLTVSGALTIQTDLDAGGASNLGFWLNNFGTDKLGINITARDTDPAEREGESVSGLLCIGSINASSLVGCAAGGGVPAPVATLGSIFGQ